MNGSTYHGEKDVGELLGLTKMELNRFEKLHQLSHMMRTVEFIQNATGDGIQEVAERISGLYPQWNVDTIVDYYRRRHKKMDQAKALMTNQQAPAQRRRPGKESHQMHTVAG